MTDVSASAPQVFADLGAQPGAVALLSAALASGRASHAYLFVGPTGALIHETARAFASALACENGGCGACDTCARVLRGAHQDVVEVAPLGARAYLAEQIRDLVVEAQYAPVAARRKVFILARADLMNQASANAFLKTLEEPPANVCFILMAPTETSVLPTVLSRCQVVRFRAIPAAEGTALVSERAHVAPDRAELALAACEGSVTDAVAFATNPASWQLRGRVLAALCGLDRADGWGALTAAKSFGEAWTAPVEDLKTAQKETREREREFLDARAMKEQDARDKRAQTAATAAGFARLTSLVRGWLADVQAAQLGMPERIANTDFAGDIIRVAGMANADGIRRGLEACSRAEQHIAYNVSAQNALDALMLELRAALFG